MSEPILPIRLSSVNHLFDSNNDLKIYYSVSIKNFSEKEVSYATIKATIKNNLPKGILTEDRKLEILDYFADKVYNELKKRSEKKINMKLDWSTVHKISPSTTIKILGNEN